MITDFRIQNLRSIKDSGEIRLKPIMILLGANSSGKSTFLRSFPLFTQSVDKKLRGPIAWFDTSFVDFGDFKTAKNRFAEEELPGKVVVCQEPRKGSQEPRNVSSEASKLRLVASNMGKGLISPSDALECLCLKGVRGFDLSPDLSPDPSPYPSYRAFLALLGRYGGDGIEKGEMGEG